ncbi:Rtr1/RPAP2 family-domain-containing protein [Hypoxylon rubiginosum]|uniref:Rtr1/RPAP2 family-domain-containing protein n=1 Tax=Hypoxylon rubiginosum TaxID=110542 RepID=A0ACB9Z7U3_9PEZI|nr:Rtr1/RPAP2 family-domain-containing protein [Hypoxylon rubiginosum]
MSSPAQSKKPKGILKKPTAPTVLAPAAAAASLTPMSPFPIQESNPAAEKPSARDVAVQQALVIQQQHALSDHIQDSIIALSYFPLTRSSSGSGSGSSSGYDAANPAPSDADAFRQHVRSFQPGDYEDMIEERNARGLCGYALCARPRIRVGGGGEYKLVNYGRKDFNIVPRRELERWCSQRCARRAMYVKVQLSETAAWERAGIPSIRIELLDEPERTGGEEEDGDDAVKQVARELRDLQIDKERKATRDAADLALERGDATDIQSTRSIDVDIMEKSVIMAAQEPSPAKDNEGHLILDGYKTKFDSRSETMSMGSNMAEVAAKIEDLSIE